MDKDAGVDTEAWVLPAVPSGEGQVDTADSLTITPEPFSQSPGRQLLARLVRGGLPACPLGLMGGGCLADPK